MFATCSDDDDDGDGDDELISLEDLYDTSTIYRSDDDNLNNNNNKNNSDVDQGVVPDDKTLESLIKRRNHRLHKMLSTKAVSFLSMLETVQQDTIVEVSIVDLMLWFMDDRNRLRTFPWRCIYGQDNGNIRCEFHAGFTILHVASLYGHTRVVETLLNNNISSRIKDPYGRTPLHIGAMMGHLPISIINFCLL